jgi:hypothetical protein
LQQQLLGLVRSSRLQCCAPKAPISAYKWNVDRLPTCKHVAGASCPSSRLPAQHRASVLSFNSISLPDAGHQRQWRAHVCWDSHQLSRPIWRPALSAAGQLPGRLGQPVQHVVPAASNAGRRSAIVSSFHLHQRHA